MNATPDYLHFAVTLLTSVGVSALLSAALVWLARTWISERLRASIQHEYDQKLASINAALKVQGDAAAARLKGEIEREADKLRLASQSFGEVQKAAIAMRLAAVEETWQTVLTLNDSVPGAVSYLDILLDNEYLGAPSKPTFQDALRRLDHVPIVTSATDRSRKLAVLRPYTGEYLWALFATYQAVVLRTTYLVDKSKTEPAKLRWFEDQLVLRHIESGLGSQALQEFQNSNFAKVSWVRDRFVHAILQAMERIVAGKETSDAAMRQAEQMEKQMREAKRAADEV